MSLKKLAHTLTRKKIHIAPLAVFRMFFGAVMLASVIRFVSKNWVHELYVKPHFHFDYYGFEWVQAFGATGMYLLFALMGASAFGIMLGWFYRLTSLVFFVTFTYVELIDPTYYLNHYYFISLVAFLMMLLPAHRYFSLDVWQKPSLKLEQVPAWTINIVRLQLGLVYFHAGAAKLNSDWLFRAMPMKIWLQAHTHWALLGSLFQKTWVAYAASWFGALYDLSIPFLISIKRTRWLAYSAVVFFHLMTAMLFPIGMFPYIMIGATLIFFPASFHLALINKLSAIGNWMGNKFKVKHLAQNKLAVDNWQLANNVFQKIANYQLFIAHLFRRPVSFFKNHSKQLKAATLILFLLTQLAMPWRYLLYPGNLFWTEEGYRFSWRVMLIQKDGTIFFNVKDQSTGNSMEVSNSLYLTPYQEKMMATQPDLILQFAHFLEKEFEAKGIENPRITTESYVALNGRGSKLFIDSTVNLAEKVRGFQHKDWILPFNRQQSQPLKAMN